MLKDTEPRLLTAEREAALDFVACDDDHFAWFDFTHIGCANDIKSTGFRAENPALADLA